MNVHSIEWAKLAAVAVVAIVAAFLGYRAGAARGYMDAVRAVHSARGYGQASAQGGNVAAAIEQAGLDRACAVLSETGRARKLLHGYQRRAQVHGLG
jgi:hypothetical protein